jgi:hypothetical protein
VLSLPTGTFGAREADTCTDKLSTSRSVSERLCHWRGLMVPALLGRRRKVCRVSIGSVSVLDWSDPEVARAALEDGRVVVRVSAEWGVVTPLWVSGAGGVLEPTDPGELPLSAGLVSDLWNWVNLWNDTYRAGDPGEGGFRDPKDLVAFEYHGYRLAGAVRAELPERYLVAYTGRPESDRKAWPVIPSRYPALAGVRSYLHTDWHHLYETSREAIDCWCAFDPGTARDAPADIRRLLDAADDAELHRELGRVGVGYWPGSDGLTDRQWLTQVADWIPTTINRLEGRRELPLSGERFEAVWLLLEPLLRDHRPVSTATLIASGRERIATGAALRAELRLLLAKCAATADAAATARSILADGLGLDIDIVGDGEASPSWLGSLLASLEVGDTSAG